MKFEQLMAVLQEVDVLTLRRAEEDIGSPLGDFVMEIAQGNVEHLNYRVEADPALLQHLREGPVQINDLALALTHLAVRCDQPASMGWLHEQGVTLDVGSLIDVPAQKHPVWTAIYKDSPNVLKWYHGQEGDSFFRANLGSHSRVFDVAIGHDNTSALLWMVNQDPSLLDLNFSVGEGFSDGPLLMDLVEYAEMNSPKGSDVPGLFRSLKLARAAQQVLVEIEGMNPAARAEVRP